MGKDQKNTLDEILTEKELLDLLGAKKSFLANLRLKKHLPFCKMTDRCRIYLVADVIEFIKTRRVILDADRDIDTEGSINSSELAQNYDNDA